MLRKIIIIVIILLPLFFLWLLNGGTFLTISEQDWFYEGEKECLTNTCLESFADFGVNPSEETSYIFHLFWIKSNIKTLILSVII